MFCRSLLASAFILTLSFRVHAHAGITPALGVTGNFTRNDVQRPAPATECGNIDIASTIDSSTPVTVAADGTFTVTVTDFNAGADGSRSVSVKVDATGVGNNFVAGTILTNGDANPTDVGSQNIVAALPAGTQCTGGKSKDLCLASFTTTSGFGNCVVVQQSGAVASPPTSSSADNAPTATTTTATSSTVSAVVTPAAKAHDCGQKGTVAVAVASPTPSARAKAKGNDTVSSESGSNAKKPCHKKHTNASAAGTRAARAARAEAVEIQ